MVSLSRVHVVGAWYMSWFGGYKPRPQAFIRYFRSNGLLPHKIFFLGNRLVDMKLATSLKKLLGCEVYKCLIIRDGEPSIASRHADAVVSDLWQVRAKIKEFNPDLVMSDFDNTLVFAGGDSMEDALESTRWWEKMGGNWLIRILYAFLSQFSVPFQWRRPYVNRYDSTEGFIRSLKVPLLIHTMSPELGVWLTLKQVFK